MQLGQLMYDEYVTKQKFLSANYSTYEIFCRSTDINQTLLSANANFLGMYYNRASEKPIVDYPDISDWPSKFVPIAIHTQLLKTDHIGYVNPECPRRDYLENLVKQTPEVKNYVKSVKVNNFSYRYV
ncbi:unnamed protein product [Anisakis simplex]|uniref:COesterase domain-containing protein n=1 Tax=Anisakis simplex TaxID=6269 RepID=A0A0M3KA60_ANISI|nr:unnamed protein product [Anisakis simplex]